VFSYLKAVGFDQLEVLMLFKLLIISILFLIVAQEGITTSICGYWIGM